MRIHLSLKQCKCDLCGAAYRTVQHVVEHKIIAHVPAGAYKCSKCSCQFETRCSLASHMGSRHPLHLTAERRMQ
jgi:hypothetical protein